MVAESDPLRAVSGGSANKTVSPSQAPGLMLTGWAGRKPRRPDYSFSVESSRPTRKEHPEVSSCCHVSIKPLQCLVGENADVFIA